MQRIITFIAPQRMIDWPLGVLIWGLAASVLGAGVEFLMMGELDDTLLDHTILTILIAAPFILVAMKLISHLDRLQRKLARLAATDLLTGLPNRRAFLEKASVQTDGIVLMIDIDHFKRINDTFGHAAGDTVLRSFAEELRASVRSTDLLGRIGGEEFAAYLIDADPEDAEKIAGRLCGGLKMPVEESDEVLTVSASIGAVESVTGQDIGDLLKHADDALYAAKAQGRARLVFCPTSAALARDAA